MKVLHVPDIQMPVDFLTKWVTGKKVEASVSYLTNGLKTACRTRRSRCPRVPSRRSSTAFQTLEEGGCVAMGHGPIRNKWYLRRNCVAMGRGPIWNTDPEL